MIENQRKCRYLLVWMDGIQPSSVAQTRRQLEDQVAVPPSQVEIDVWIESPGGDAHSAYKLALMLRHAAARIRVVVPDYAKSAATLLALSGDTIYMAPGAELGPLDAQTFEEGSIKLRSALDIARAADELSRDAINLATAGGAQLLAATGLSRAEMLKAMLSFSAQLYEPLVAKLDPKAIHEAKELLRVTAHYAERLLAGRVDDPAGIATSLVEKFPTHGCVVSCDDAKELGLPVEAIQEYPLLDAVRRIHRQAEYGQHMVQLLDVDKLLDDEGQEVDDEGKTEAQGEQHDEKVQKVSESIPAPRKASKPSAGSERVGKG